MNVARRVLAVIVGMLAGGAVIAAIERLGSGLQPVSDGLSTGDPQALHERIVSRPLSAFLLMLLGWSAGAVVGGFLARRLAPGRASLPGWIVVGLLTAATIGNLVMLPHPWWMWPAGVAVCLAFGSGGLLLAAPGTYTIALTRDVRAPLDRVFQTLARAENVSEAVPGIVRIEFLGEQKHGVGTRFRETRLLSGKEAGTVLEVTEQVENQRIRIVSEAGGTRWDTVFTVRPTGDGARVDLRMDVRPRRLLARFTTPLILGVVGRAVESDMDAVKAYCESGAELCPV